MSSRGWGRASIHFSDGFARGTIKGSYFRWLLNGPFVTSGRFSECLVRWWSTSVGGVCVLSVCLYRTCESSGVACAPRAI